MAEDKKDDAKKGDDETQQVMIQVDARINWFEEKVCAALKIKNDKWKKMTAAQENL